MICSMRKDAANARAGSASYTAYKQKLLAQLDREHAGLSFAQEQQRLRVHLRRIILLNEREADRPVRETTPPISNLGHIHVWREAAIGRDRQRLLRHRAASVIQATVRRWLQFLRQNESELPSDSAFIAVQTNHQAPTHATHRTSSSNAQECFPRPQVHVEDHQYSSVLPVVDEPFMVIIELLGARDLAAAVPPHLRSNNTIIVEVRLVRQPGDTVLGQFATAPAPAESDGHQWDDQFTQIGVDPDASPRPFSVIQDCSVVAEVTLVDESSQCVTIGRVVLAMDLLETPLADKYAMTRWFPLEKMPGRGSGPRPVRGELRLSIRYLMRNPEAQIHEDADVWVPYVGPTTPDAATGTTTEKPMRRPSRRVNKVEGTKDSHLTKPPLSPRRETPSAERPPSPVRKPRPRSPLRPARVEAISPPSSPSSYSSDNSNAVDSDAPNVASPIHTRSAMRSPSPTRPSSGGIARRQQQGRQSSKGTQEEPLENSEVQQEQSSGDSPKPRFLKRKPFKIVFQKLDWSKVGSKTDSNWGTAKSGSGNSPRRTADTGASVGSDTMPPNKHATEDGDHLSRIDQLLAIVSAEVLAACELTTQTAPLAQMKFKAERKRFAQALQPLEQPQSLPSTMEDEVQMMWSKLHADADGVEYVELLKGILKS